MKNIFVLLFCLLSQGALSEEVYPSQPPVRPLGLDQQNVGSCMAEAAVNALEYHFAEKGMRTKFSTFYQHIIEWSHKPRETPQQILSSKDLSFIADAPRVLPNYMWPEDSQGLPRLEGRLRPSLSLAANIDRSYPKGKSAFGYNEKFYTFRRAKQGSYSNKIDIEGIKNLVRSRNAITVGMHSDLMKLFDVYTGLLKKRYTDRSLRDQFPPGEDYEEAHNHQVAIVGFDDNLYRDHGYSFGAGAFIVANSWVSPDDIRLVENSPSWQQQRDLEKMRLKVHSDNLPAYYAIPYQYFYDTIHSSTSDPESRSGVGGVTHHQINVEQYYAIQSVIAQRYKVHTVPFTCDRQDLVPLALDFADTTERMGSKSRLMELIRLNLERKYTDSFSRTFRYAKLSHNTYYGTNRMDDFLNGRFDDYYCQGESGEVFPRQHDLSDTELEQLLEDTWIEPSVGSVYTLLKWVGEKFGVGND